VSGDVVEFSAVVVEGHGTCALFVPFHPAERWPHVARVKIPRPDDPRGGQGWLVSGTLNGKAFDGHVGHRYGNSYIILSDTLLRHVGIAAGDAVDVVVAPIASASPTKTSKKKTTSTTKKKKKKKPTPRP
jgi:hypothetical protein